ncbi:DUF2783 domain-containing protein [Roseomonas sp. AR75]|uniref:DUF2783 domain-containing protein n=1 Tax=Roseomonas sp. AR75 TaxID=2562311 RepID=UPI0010C0A5C8|nr:DUF2783 domain-containing protein [Roseomonas sp. AR75]
MTLHGAPRIADPDGFFQLLVEAHRDLSAEESRRLDARLVLILANEVGDMAVLRAAIAAAKDAGAPVSGAGRSPSHPQAG